MTKEYAAQKTKEIMIKVQGQSKLAEQALLSLAQKDHAFLFSLVQPYLNGIITHAIERARGRSESPRKPEAATPKTAPKRPATARPMPATGMDNVMAAWAKSFEQGQAPQKAEGQKVSSEHLNAMQALIKKKI